MRALLVDRAAPGGVRLGRTAAPEPAAHEALVRVRAASLNYGEVVLAAGPVVEGVGRPPDGTVLGADAAGIVQRAARDGSGPTVGTPVVTLGETGAWAELRAVPTTSLGIVPDGADLGAISTVPVAGLTALRALRRTGPLLGRRILVTGATGGVGRFTVQLAHRSGAHVVATTSDPAAYGADLRGLGADEVVRGPGDDRGDGFDGVVDMLGGPTLVAAFRALRPHGVLVAVGHSAGEGESFDFGDLFGNGGRHDRSLATFYLADTAPAGADLTWLAERVAVGRLHAPVAWRAGWEDIGDAFAALLGRHLHGKAVIELT